jgi:hypothetical protein
MSPFLAAVALLLVSCAGSSPPTTTAEPIQQAEALPLQIAFQGLCDARTVATAGDAVAASDFFQDRSHAYLHEFASRISVSDREGTARLLEAKQTVEAQLADPGSADPQAVAAALAALETALADAAETAGFERPVCGMVAP